ncbi:hypothetical protein E2542_SST02373 [Spatholobus suberectus]|nr:hypothetical protein E2542_SST02373 [Spatholobus suberectus]
MESNQKILGQDSPVDVVRHTKPIVELQHTTIDNHCTLLTPALGERETAKHDDVTKVGSLLLERSSTSSCSCRHCAIIFALLIVVPIIELDLEEIILQRAVRQRQRYTMVAWVSFGVGLGFASRGGVWWFDGNKGFGGGILAKTVDEDFAVRGVSSGGPQIQSAMSWCLEAASQRNFVILPMSRGSRTKSASCCHVSIWLNQKRLAFEKVVLDGLVRIEAEDNVILLLICDKSVFDRRKMKENRKRKEEIEERQEMRWSTHLPNTLLLRTCLAPRLPPLARVSPTVPINPSSRFRLRSVHSLVSGTSFPSHPHFLNHITQHIKVETKGGCCIARCATRAHHMSKVDRIMLRFRPIAPKPLPAAALSDASSSESGADAFSRCGGAKRKHAKDNGKRCSRGIRRRRNAPPPPAVTLPLLPETPDPKKTTPEAKSKTVPLWLSFENRGGAVSEKVDRGWYPPAAGSVVTVECVMDTWQQEEEEGLGLGSGDEERKVKLGEDTCPGFISDGYGRVTWTNGAYREAVGEGGVWLAMKVTVPYPYRGFTCRVRVQYACGKERTVPCDVWRMDSGGFAWRLDVKAALSLSLAL